MRITLELVQDRYQKIPETLERIRQGSQSKYPEAREDKLTKKVGALAEQMEAEMLYLSTYSKALDDM